MAFNLFSAITSGIGAYNTLKQINKPTQPTTPEVSGEGMLGPTTDTRTTLQKVAPGVSNTIGQLGTALESSKIGKAVSTAKPLIKDIGNKLAPVGDALIAPVKPIIDNYNTNEAKRPFQEQLSKLGITAQHLDEMGLSEEEKQAVKDLYSQVGVEIPGLAQMEQAKIQSQDIAKNADARTGLLENIGGSITDFVGGAVSEVPNVLGNTASFLNDVSQYNPATYLGGLIGDTAKSALTDTTFSQARQDRSQANTDLSNTLQGAGKTGKEFVQKYGAYDPNTISSKVGETATDIGASVVGPNKVGILKPGFLGTAGNLALEGGLAGAKYGVASNGEITPSDVVGGALGNTVVGGAFKVGGKIAKSVLPKTAEEKILESVGGNSTEGIVNGKKIKVPVPQEGLITKLSTPLRTNDPKILTGRALTPSYAGKTPKQMLKSVGEMTDNVKNFYSQVRTGKMKGNINTIEDSANTVINNLDSIGAKIGDAVKGAKGNTSISMGTRSEISRSLRNKIEKRSGAFTPLNNFYKDTKGGLNLNDAFKAKKVYQAEITKLIKAGDAGTDSYQALVKGVQELSDNIDNVVEKSLGSKQFLEWKKQYKLLKSIASDISKSAVVEGRRSPQTFVEQLGTLQAITEGITSPLSTAKSLFAKEIGELNTRGGAWKELIKNYDKEAINAVKKPILKPKKVKVGL